MSENERFTQWFLFLCLRRELTLDHGTEGFGAAAGAALAVNETLQGVADGNDGAFTKDLIIEAKFQRRAGGERCY